MNAWLETADGVRVPLHNVCSIGRAPQNTIVLSDHRVSRRHTLIHSQGAGVYQLVDLGSSNGVAVNGHRVKGSVQLHDKDRIEIADSGFTFSQAETVPADAAIEGTTFMSFGDLKKSPLWLLVAQIHKESHARLSEDEQSQQAGTWLLGCHEVIERHGGVVNKYMGDGFLAYWPNPEAPSGDLLSTVKALHQLQTSKSPPFRIALHHGSVAIDKAAAGDGDVLLGPEVTVAFRLERLAEKTGEDVVVSEAARQKLAADCSFRALGEHTLPNISSALALFAPTL